LKPGQRKILLCCFKRKLKAEIKVAQLSGYVAEHPAYHHGEMSLASTIVGLAQNFVWSNNLNLLLPLGQLEVAAREGRIWFLRGIFLLFESGHSHVIYGG
jgi:DNA topoisomerase-2